MTQEPTVKLSLLMHYELPYEDVQHLMALPIESRKAALFYIIMHATPTNDRLEDFEMHHFRQAIGKAYFERLKSETEYNQKIAAMNAIPAFEVL